jgi:hypothetical protein
MVETREAHNLEVAGSNPVPATSFHALLICPTCNGHCVMIFDCHECDFLGCGNCYDKHTHSSDSDVARERYRDQMPKDAGAIQQPDEQPEAEQPPRVIQIDRFRQRPEPTQMPRLATCSRCHSHPCICSPLAASEVSQ